MTRQGIAVVPVVCLLVLGGVSTRAADKAPAPDFNEVYNLVKQHLTGISEAELNRAAVQGLITALAPKVSLAGAEPPGTNSSAALVTKTSLFDGPIGYIRVGRVGEGLASAIRKAWQDLGSSNKLDGLVLDLRYSDGSDYAEAAATADEFTKKDQALLDWGAGLVRSKEKQDAPGLAVAVLVNEKTAAASEALAAVLREVGAGLVIGRRTAGQAMIAKAYPLSDGQQLRIATTPVVLGDGTSLSSEGIKPDIQVDVPPAEERVYFNDPFKELSGGPQPQTAAAAASGAGPRARRLRMNEAELVRERRSGALSEVDTNSVDRGEVDKPTVQDPVLARALDFLKGLSVIRQTHS